MDAKKYPNIARVLNARQAFLEQVTEITSVLVGEASDGQFVTLGNVGTRKECEQTERYLVERPTPDKW